MNLQIGLPCTPSYFNDSVEIFEGYEITITYGGGMGGASRTIYVRDIPQFDFALVKINTIFNEEYILNRDYIAFMKKVGIVITDVHTDNSYMIKDNCHNFKVYYTYDCNEYTKQDVVVVEKYMDIEKSNAKFIKKVYYKD